MSKSQSDATRVYSILRELVKDREQPVEDTFELVELIRNMASKNVISQVEAKLDALNTKYTVLIWMIGFTIGLLSLLLILEK